MDRIREIDIGKGICILLMVIGHSGLKGFLHEYIYAFHMPFFFFVSGMTTDFSRPIKDYVIKKTNNLLIPFIIYFLIQLPIYAFFNNKSLLSQLYIFISDGVSSALWFVPILYLSLLIIRFVPKTTHWEILSFLFWAATSSVLVIEGVIFPWCLSMLPISAAFVLLGRMMFGGVISMIHQHNLLVQICFILLFAIATATVSSRYHLAMYFSSIEPCLPIMIGALTGIMFVLLLSIIICKKMNLLTQFLGYTGVNTFVFLGFSQLILKYENLYIREYVLLKYAILFIAMYLLIWLKNRFSVAKRCHL